MEICILMSTYNGEKYIKEQIDSIIAQKGVDFKLIIRDDGSKDGTYNIIKEYVNKYPQKIEVYWGNNLGFALSFSELIKIAYYKYPECKYFAFADQDDVWLKNKLDVAVKMIEKESENIPACYCSNTILVNEDLSVIGKCWKKNSVKITKERALVQSFATGCTMLFNRYAAKLYITHLPSDLKVHDFFLYQLCVFLGKVIYDDNSYILYRQHGNNQLGKQNFIGRWKTRIKKKKYKEHVLEKQCRNFLSATLDLLKKEDIEIISQLLDYKKSFYNRLFLLFNSKIVYNNLEANIFLKIKILLGTL